MKACYRIPHPARHAYGAKVRIRRLWTETWRLSLDTDIARTRWRDFNLNPRIAGTVPPPRTAQARPRPEGQGSLLGQLGLDVLDTPVPRPPSRAARVQRRALTASRSCRHRARVRARGEGARPVRRARRAAHRMHSLSVRPGTSSAIARHLARGSSVLDLYLNMAASRARCA